MNTVPPKIAMIIDDNFPPDPRVGNECRALSAFGCRVDLYCITYGNEPLRESNDYMNIIRVPVPSYYKSISALAYTFPFYHIMLYRKFKRVLDLEEYDILHIHDIQVARTAFWLSRKKNVSLILDLHENRPEIMKYYDHVKALRGRLLIYPSIWKKFEKYYIQKADKTLVITEQARDYYVKQYGIRRDAFEIIPNAVSRSFYENYERRPEISGLYKDRFVLLYLGNTNERRGMRTVLKAIKLLKEDIPEILFLCVGKSKSDPFWQDIVNAEGLSKYVELKGWQEFEYFPSYAEICDIGLCPLNRNIHHDTTLANKIFQYMAFGKPVIVSDCTAQAELVEGGNCGLVFQAGNEFDFRDKCLTLYKDAKSRNEMGKSGKELLEKEFLWEGKIDQLLELYKHVI